MISNKLILIKLTLVVVRIVNGHTWLDCVDLQSDNGCLGYPRGYVGHIDRAMTYKILGRDKRVPICHPGTQDSPNKYTKQYPRTKLQPGETANVQYDENGHVTKDRIGPYNKPNPKFISFHWTGKPFKGNLHDGSQLLLRGDINKKNQLGPSQPFDDGRCAEDRSTGRMEPQACQAKYTIPINTKPGIYQIVWLWKFDKVFDAGGEEYTTCFDVEVMSKDLIQTVDKVITIKKGNKTVKRITRKKRSKRKSSKRKSKKGKKKRRKGKKKNRKKRKNRELKSKPLQLPPPPVVTKHIPSTIITRPAPTKSIISVKPKRNLRRKRKSKRKHKKQSSPKTIIPPQPIPKKMITTTVRRSLPSKSVAKNRIQTSLPTSKIVMRPTFLPPKPSQVLKPTKPTSRAIKPTLPSQTLKATKPTSPSQSIKSIKPTSQTIKPTSQTMKETKPTSRIIPSSKSQTIPTKSQTIKSTKKPNQTIKSTNKQPRTIKLTKKPNHTIKSTKKPTQTKPSTNKQLQTKKVSNINPTLDDDIQDLFSSSESPLNKHMEFDEIISSSNKIMDGRPDALNPIALGKTDHSKKHLIPKHPGALNPKILEDSNDIPPNRPDALNTRKSDDDIPFRKPLSGHPDALNPKAFEKTDDVPSKELSPDNMGELKPMTSEKSDDVPLKEVSPDNPGDLNPTTLEKPDDVPLKEVSTDNLSELNPIPFEKSDDIPSNELYTDNPSELKPKPFGNSDDVPSKELSTDNLSELKPTAFKKSDDVSPKEVSNDNPGDLSPIPSDKPDDFPSNELSPDNPNNLEYGNPKDSSSMEIPQNNPDSSKGSGPILIKDIKDTPFPPTDSLADESIRPVKKSTFTDLEIFDPDLKNPLDDTEPSDDVNLNNSQLKPPLTDLNHNSFDNDIPSSDTSTTLNPGFKVAENML